MTSSRQNGQVGTAVGEVGSEADHFVLEAEIAFADGEVIARAGDVVSEEKAYEIQHSGVNVVFVDSKKVEAVNLVDSVFD